MKTEQDTLDRVSEIGKETLEKLEKEKKAKESEKAQKTKEESTDASLQDSSLENNEKTEGSKKTEDNDDSDSEKTDEQLLETNDDELTEDEKSRKQEVINKKESSKSPEEKLKEWQDKTQERIDSLISELKAEKSSRKQDQEKIDMLNSVIDSMKGDLERSGNIESDEDKMIKSENEIYSRMIDEDKELPKSKRREMSKDDLEEFLLEDMVEANEWIVRRERRREKDRESRLKGKDTAKTIQDSAKKFYEEFPECNVEQRGNELVNQGKTESEAIKIIMDENPDFKLMMDLINSNKEFSDPKNPQAPILLAKAMREKKSSGKKTYTEEEVQKMVKEAQMKEDERLKSIDAGVSSTGLSNKKASSKDPMYQKGLELFLKASKTKGKNWTEDDYKKVLERGNRLRAADSGR